jgi:hypothetical protein
MVLSRADFTLGKYERLCHAIAGSRYRNSSLAAYLQLPAEQSNSPHVLMRHDIDRAPGRALDTAMVEHRHGVRATYYFRIRGLKGASKIIDQVAGLGHEIGYHYETLDRCRGNLEAAQALFRDDLADFRARYDVKTVCAHGNPLTKYDNTTIWNASLRLKDCGLLGEAFLSFDFDRFAYFSDSGRTWANSPSQKMPGKDQVVSTIIYALPHTTDDLTEMVREGKLENIIVLVHPERWTGKAFDYAVRYCVDLVFAAGKIVIFGYRRARGQW